MSNSDGAAQVPNPTSARLGDQRSQALSQRLQQRLWVALEEPLSPDRSAMVQQVARAARHAGLHTLELQARLEEAWDAFQSGQTTRALSVFSWVLDQFWQDEANFSLTERESLWQQFLWVPPLAARNPAVSGVTVEQLLQYLDSFSLTLFPSEGEATSLRHLWTIHYQVALGLGQRFRAGQALAVARQAVRDEEAVPGKERGEETCPLHMARPAIAWAASSSDFSRALELADQAGQECEKFGYTCRQPQDLDPVLMLPLAWAGKGQAAWQAHQRGFRHQLQTSQFLGDLAAHLRYCVATWNLDWGLELLSQHSQWFSSPEDPWDLLTSLRAGAALLQKISWVAKRFEWDQPKLGFSLSGDNPFLSFPSLGAGDTVDAGAQTLRRAALILAGRYDLRNQNNAISLRTNQILAEPTLCPFTEIQQLLYWRHRRTELLSRFAIPALDAAWVVGKVLPQNNPSSAPKMRPSQHWETHWAEFEQVLDALTVLPTAPGTFVELDLLSVLSDKIALATTMGHFDLVTRQAPAIIDNALALPWPRLALRTACYLVQAQWASSDLSGARQTLMLADSIADETVGAPAHDLLEHLAALAG